MVDVVTNHMGYNGCRSCVDYSIFNPFSSASFFHPGCDIHYADERSVQQCWQGDEKVSLPDLRTEDQNVRDIWNDWIKQMVAKYHIDGIRLDSAKHVETSFLAPFEAASGVFMIGEVYHGDPAYTLPYQNHMSGVMNYPAFYWIVKAFSSTSGSIYELVEGIDKVKNSARDTSLLGSFLENHDQPRFAHKTKDMALTKNAIAFTALMDGIPIIYQGQEHRYDGGGDPHNREALWFSGYSTTSELYHMISSLLKVRSHAIAQHPRYLDYKAWPILSNEHMIAMRKGFDQHQLIGVYSNVGNGNSYSVTLDHDKTGFRPSQSLLEVLSCNVSDTDSNGNLRVESNSGEPKVFYPLERLSGSGICTALTGKTEQPPTLITARPLLPKL
jgi:alpha-amylase